MIRFLGANLFLLFMGAVGLAVGVGLFELAQLAGAEGDLLHWLTLPIGLAAVLACGFAGRLAHHFLARFI